MTPLLVVRGSSSSWHSEAPLMDCSHFLPSLCAIPNNPACHSAARADVLGERLQHEKSGIGTMGIEPQFTCQGQNAEKLTLVACWIALVVELHQPHRNACIHLVVIGGLA